MPEEQLQKMNKGEIPYLMCEKSHPRCEPKFTRRSPMARTLSNRVCYPINYGISSTLRKLPVVFHPDRHSAALAVRSPSTRMMRVPAGTLNAQAI